MNKVTYRYIVTVDVDLDHPACTDPQEVQDQIEHALLGGDEEVEQGILDCKIMLQDDGD